MKGSHLYQRSIKGTNEDTTSSYSDHQLLQDSEPRQSLYMKAFGTNLNMIAEQRNLTLGMNDPTSMSSMEKVSLQTTNKSLNHQTKNQQYPDHSQKTPATTNQCSVTYQQLSKNLHHQQHQEPPTYTIEENPESYHLQTHTALALLLLAKNNNQPQLIW
jgi:hypothetical protein